MNRKKNHTKGYLHALRITIGDMILDLRNKRENELKIIRSDESSINLVRVKTPRKPLIPLPLGYWLIDTPKDRAMGLLVTGISPNWLVRKLEEWGIMVFSITSYPARGFGLNMINNNAVVAVIRLPEKQDIQKARKR